MSRTPNTDQELAITRYLQDHPDFFERFTYLLRELKVPHPSGAASSLIERQVAKLREDHAALLKEKNSLLANARANAHRAESLHRLTLDMLDAEDMDEIIAVLRQGLISAFNASHVNLCVFAVDPIETATVELRVVGQDEPELGLFDHLFAGDRAICGRLLDQQARYLFGADADAVRSAAMIPCVHARFRAVLGIASEAEDHFQPEMGTLFLDQLGELVTRALQRHLLPRDSK